MTPKIQLISYIIVCIIQLLDKSSVIFKHVNIVIISFSPFITVDLKSILSAMPPTLVFGLHSCLWVHPMGNSSPTQPSARSSLGSATLQTSRLLCRCPISHQELCHLGDWVTPSLQQKGNLSSHYYLVLFIFFLKASYIWCIRPLSTNWFAISHY